MKIVIVAPVLNLQIIRMQLSRVLKKVNMNNLVNKTNKVTEPYNNKKMKKLFIKIKFSSQQFRDNKLILHLKN